MNAVDILKTSTDPKDHVLFSNFFAEAEKCDDVLRQRSVIDANSGSLKKAGKSSVFV